MKLNNKLKLMFLLLFGAACLNAQTVSEEQMVFITAQWQGERFADGRPKVADDILERIKSVTIEEAWGAMRGQGYYNQFEGDWMMIHEDMPMTGRALTAQYMPTRPDINDIITKKGTAEDTLLNKIKEDNKLNGYLNNKDIKKKIFIPDRLINIITN